MKQGYKNQLDKHHNCRVVIIDRYVKGQPVLRPALYCAEHVKWIKWLTLSESKEFQELGVEHMGALASEETKLQQQQV